MKRRSRHHGISNETATMGDLSISNGGGGGNDGWSCHLGCNGGGNNDNSNGIGIGTGTGTGRDNVFTTAIVSSSSSIDGTGKNSTDLFLNQTSYVSNSRRGLSSSNKPKRSSSKKKSGVSKKKQNTKNSGDELNSLIASELTKMSLEDREKALEEVHGVISDQEEEDPEQISKLLSQVKEELKRIRYKQAYEKAAFISNSYVTDPEFVLMFLRADDFQARPAALRLVEHFRYKLELFGEEAIVRDIMYDDLTDAEKSVLHSGFLHASSLIDRAGRQIVICNLSEFLNNNCKLKNMNRAMWYISIRNAQLNASRGKNGIVGVYFTHGMSNIFEKFTREGLNNRKGFYLERALPYKYSGVHYCFDNNPLAIGIQTTLMMSLGRYARVRLRSHCGSRLECAYALKSFGIDIDNLESVNSLSLSGSIQASIKRCQFMDGVLKAKQDVRLLPQPKDALLGRGRPFQNFPGNLALTDIINVNRTRYAASKKMDKKIITTEIVNGIRNSGGRFLRRVNDDNHSEIDWEEVDFETARLKVSHSFRTMTKWHANHDNNTYNQAIAESDEFTHSMVAEEFTSIGIVAESTPSSATAQAGGNIFETSNKRRRG